MAFDLKGIEPTAPIGEYFRVNIWKWHELWGFLNKFYPDCTPSIELWYTNDGEKVSYQYSKLIHDCLSADAESSKLSEHLNQFIASRQGMRYTTFNGYRPLSEVDIQRFIIFLKQNRGFTIE